jgi:hypothetical protein
MPRLFYLSLVVPLKPAIKVCNQHPDKFECIGGGRVLGVIPALLVTWSCGRRWGRGGEALGGFAGGGEDFYEAVDVG